MSEQPVNMGFTSAPPAAAAASPPSQPSSPLQPADNPRTRGHSPARDHREQIPGGAERKVSIGGVEYDELAVADAMAERVERQLARDALPQDPRGYEIKLPDGFKPPEGMQFEFKTDDPALIEARKAAHELKLDQAGFSRMLGIYAATKVQELQQVNASRDAQMAKLGSAAPQRIDAVETWLKAKVGDKANIAIATLKQYPVAANVEMFEGIIRAFSSQGGSGFTQSGREGQDSQGKIPGYDNMSFAQRRVAQMQSTPPQRGSRGEGR
jgi:hypothetical protein